MIRRNYALAFGAVLGVGCLGACGFLAAAFLLVGTFNPFAAPTATPGLVVNTPTPVGPGPTETPIVLVSPTPSAPTPEPSATASPAPTSTPVPGTLRFRVWRVIEPPPCEGRSLINGTVYDAQGKGLPALEVRLYNLYGYQALFTTWTTNRPGYYEFFMGPSSDDFLVEIRDPGGVRISEVAEIHYQPNCVSSVDWRANY